MYSRSSQAFAHDVRIVGRIAQHNHVGVFGQRQAANQISGRFGGGSMLDSLLGTVLFGVVRDLPWDAISRRRNQQAEGKAVASLDSDFLLVVAASFFGASFSVAGAVGVLRFTSALAGKRGVDDVEELSLAGFHMQEGHAAGAR